MARSASLKLTSAISSMIIGLDIAWRSAWWAGLL
jgi:hypothetical protein